MGGPRKGARVSVLDLPKEAQKSLKILSPRHKIFVLAYLACWNIRKSAVEAGYSAVSASDTGNSLMRREDIRKCIELACAGVMPRTEILQRKGGIARADIYEFLSFDLEPVQVSKLVKVSTILEGIEKLIQSTSDQIDILEPKAKLSVVSLELLDGAKKALFKLLERKSKLLEELMLDPDAVTVVTHWEEQLRPRLDLEKAERNNKSHLAKKIKETKFGLEIELHDAMAAQDKLGEHMGLWNPSSQPNTEKTPLEQMNEHMAEVRAARAAKGKP